MDRITRLAADQSFAIRTRSCPEWALSVVRRHRHSSPGTRWVRVIPTDSRLACPGGSGTFNTAGATCRRQRAKVQWHSRDRSVQVGVLITLEKDVREPMRLPDNGNKAAIICKRLPLVRQSGTTHGPQQLPAGSSSAAHQPRTPFYPGAYVRRQHRVCRAGPGKSCSLKCQPENRIHQRKLSR